MFWIASLSSEDRSDPSIPVPLRAATGFQDSEATVDPDPFERKLAVEPESSMSAGGAVRLWSSISSMSNEALRNAATGFQEPEATVDPDSFECKLAVESESFMSTSLSNEELKNALTGFHEADDTVDPESFEYPLAVESESSASAEALPVRRRGRPCGIEDCGDADGETEGRR
jgi:hypothetical protein